MSGTATYELTAQDHVDAVHTHTGRIFGKLAWVLLAAATLKGLGDVLRDQSFADDAAFWAMLGGATLLFAWDRFARDWIVRRNYRQGVAMHSSVRLGWDGEKISFHTDASQSEYRWDQFWRWIASGSSLLLYRDSQTFFPIPLRALPEGAAAEMISALEAAGVREKGRLQSAQSSPMSS